MEVCAVEGLSAHASARMQQRGITQEALFYLLEYGREVHDHCGRITVYFDKEACKRLERDASGPLRKHLVQITRLYAVLANDGEIVTVGYRYRRINRE